MERLPADKNVVSFDILDIFNENTTEMEQIDPNQLPDNVLQEILNNENFENENNVTEAKAQVSLEQDDSQGSEAKSNRFRPVTKTDVDDIASRSVKKKTHKQTVWGVKIFQGK